MTASGNPVLLVNIILKLLLLLFKISSLSFWALHFCLASEIKFWWGSVKTTYNYFLECLSNKHWSQFSKRSYISTTNENIENGQKITCAERNTNSWHKLNVIIWRIISFGSTWLQNLSSINRMKLVKWQWQIHKWRN